MHHRVIPTICSWLSPNTCISIYYYILIGQAKKTIENLRLQVMLLHASGRITLPSPLGPCPPVRLHPHRSATPQRLACPPRFRLLPTHLHFTGRLALHPLQRSEGGDARVLHSAGAFPADELRRHLHRKRDACTLKP